MDQIVLVESEFADGQQFLEELVQRGEDIRAAGWVKMLNRSTWHLYLALPGVNKKGAAVDAYTRILPVLRDRPHPLLFSWSSVSVIDAKDPMAVAMADFERRYPGRRSVLPYRSDRLGNVEIEGAYIYPAVTPPKSPPE